MIHNSLIEFLMEIVIIGYHFEEDTRQDKKIITLFSAGCDYFITYFG